MARHRDPDLQMIYEIRSTINRTLWSCKNELRLPILPVIRRDSEIAPTEIVFQNIHSVFIVNNVVYITNDKQISHFISHNNIWFRCLSQRNQ